MGRRHVPALGLGPRRCFRLSERLCPGTEEGMTRAKPEIWLNTGDFSRLADFRREAGKLASVAAEGDRAVSAQFGATGKTCEELP